MPSALSRSLLLACLTYPLLVAAKGGGVHVKTGSSDQTCYDVNHRVIECPKKPWTVGKIIGVVVVVIFVVVVFIAAIIIKYRKSRAATKYQSLPTPASQSQASFIPPSQASFIPPPQTYSTPSQPPYNQPQQAQFIPPPQTSYVPQTSYNPPGPPGHY